MELRSAQYIQAGEISSKDPRKGWQGSPFSSSVCGALKTGKSFINISFLIFFK